MAFLCSGIASADDGWSLETGGEYADIGISGGSTSWSAGRLQIAWRDQTRGGARFAVEPQARDDLRDVAVVAGGFRHLGGWTVSGEAAFTPSADFYYKRAGELELARRPGGGFVAHAGFRRLEFASADVDIWMPALSRYASWGEVQVRGFVGRNRTAGTDSIAVLSRGAVQVSRVVRIEGGIAVGERIFDVTSLLGQPQDGFVAFVGGRFRLGDSRYLRIELRHAQEDPGFRQQAVGIYWVQGL